MSGSATGLFGRRCLRCGAHAAGDAGREVHYGQPWVLMRAKV
jgi:hypothetical protein